jgi:hypothetical protein
MKNQSKKSTVLGVIAAAMILTSTLSAWAQGGKKHGRSFRRGVCVGQTLAQEGVILPKPQPGQRPVFDPATQAAFKAAVQSCKANFKGTGSQPTS